MGFWGRLFGRLRRRGVEPASEPASETPTLAVVAPSAAPDAQPYSRILITYRDAGGNETERVITIGEIDPREPARLVAFCHLRGAVRTFYVSRICGLCDPHTGEVMTSVTFAADAAAFRRLTVSHQHVEAKAPFASIAEAFSHYSQTLAASGWVVQTRSEPSAEYVGLHRRYRKGDRVVKWASVSLGYEPFTAADFDGPGGGPAVPGRARQRPWIVEVAGRRRASFASAAAAAAAFEAAAGDDEVKRA